MCICVCINMYMYMHPSVYRYVSRTIYVHIYTRIESFRTTEHTHTYTNVHVYTCRYSQPTLQKSQANHMTTPNLPSYDNPKPMSSRAQQNLNPAGATSEPQAGSQNSTMHLGLPRELQSGPRACVCTYIHMYIRTNTTDNGNERCTAYTCVCA